MQQIIECDYLVIGTGAMGMAFADELHTQRPDAEIVLVDQRAKPGGHWNDAYRYVTLHQPAAFYGVNSRKLGPGGAALATCSEILTYYEKVLDKLTASGKVRHFPQCRYAGGHEFESLLARDVSYRAHVRSKVVDSSYMKVEVPSTTPPKYEVADDANFMPPNGLPLIREAPERYVVIGAGKTGMDAVLFLLSQGTDPAAITWIMSNDAWLLDRDMLTPGRTLGWFLGQLQLIERSDSLEEVFLKTEEAKSFMRLDLSVWPTKFRCATVNRTELEALRSIENVVRMGRVSRVEAGRLELDGGTLEVERDTVFVDCTADGLAKREKRDVFDGSQLTLQSVFMCQQVFSAALIAYVETRFEDDDAKNRLCQVVPHPEFNLDYLSTMATSNQNFDRWGQSLFGWLRRSRLALPHHESFPKLLLNSYRAKRLGPGAVATMERIIEQEVGAGDSRGVA